MAVASDHDVAALAAHHWGQWEAAIHARDDIALGALDRLLEGMARIEDEHGVTERQLDVLHLLAQGCTTRAVAERLGIGVETVKTHLKHIRAVLGAQTSTQAVAIAWRAGLIE